MVEDQGDLVLFKRAKICVVLASLTLSACSQSQEFPADLQTPMGKITVNLDTGNQGTVFSGKIYAPFDIPNETLVVTSFATKTIYPQYSEPKSSRWDLYIAYSHFDEEFDEKLHVLPKGWAQYQDFVKMKGAPITNWNPAAESDADYSPGYSPDNTEPAVRWSKVSRDHVYWDDRNGVKAFHQILPLGTLGYQQNASQPFHVHISWSSDRVGEPKE